jgi:hypothetical protein
VKFKEDINATLVTNDFCRRQLDYDDTFYVTTLSSFASVLKVINNYKHSFIIFEYVLQFFNDNEKQEIVDCLKDKHISFLNITNDAEEYLFSDYLYVMENGKLAMDGKIPEILNEETKLKRMGVSLPFVVDLSMQLKVYNVLDKVYIDYKELIGDLYGIK